MMTEKILPGTIMAYGGSKNTLKDIENSGWLLCDGKLYDRTKVKYTNLFGAVGTAYGGDGANLFAVPDFRGMFLRGVSEGTTNDPQAAERKAPRPDLNNSGNAGNAVGSEQDDSLGKHSHSFDARFAEAEGGGGFNGYAFESNSHNGNKIFSMTEAGNDETRPKNSYVYYIIKL